MSTALGEKIRKLRKEKGLTLEKLAEMSGSSKSYIWELENKNPPRPSADKISKISAALCVTIEYLIDNERKITEDEAADEMFFRKFKEMDPVTKKNLRRMIEEWEKE